MAAVLGAQTPENVEYVYTDGYTLWAESVEKPILKILKKYGIR